MKVVCVWHIPPLFLFEKEPFDDPSETSTICPECYEKLMEQNGLPSAKVPVELGKCEITRVEEKGDLHVMCREKFYRVGTDGAVAEESEPKGLSELEPIDEPAPERVDFVEKALEEPEELEEVET